MNVEDAANPIVEFFHKLLGRNLWILPTALSISSWFIYNQDESRWYMLFCAILFGLITILYIIVCICSFIHRIYVRYCEEKEAEEIRIKKVEAAKVKQREDNEQYASYIWKLVCHADADSISVATLLLSCEMLDNDRHIRFVPFPKNNNRNSDEQIKLNAFCEISSYFSYYNSSYSTIELIKREQCREGIYFHIEPYFYLLLENYLNNNQWEKVALT